MRRFTSFVLLLGWIGLWLIIKASPARAESPRALPVDVVPVANEASPQSVTFNVHSEGDSHLLVVTPGTTSVRVDLPTDRYSVIYDPRTDHYTGLEHSNDTYWEFTWAQVREQVESSKRAEARLRDLGTEGLGGYQAIDTNSASASGLDSAGYVWQPTQERKRIARVECIRWEGTTATGETIQAWCTPSPLPGLQVALEDLRLINEPMALVPVRQLVPPLVFTVYDALKKGGVTPLLIVWGADREKNQFSYVESKPVHEKASLFAVPKFYMKTTLITMDGLLNPAKQEAPSTLVPPENKPGVSPALP